VKQVAAPACPTVAKYRARTFHYIRPWFEHTTNERLPYYTGFWRKITPRIVICLGEGAKAFSN